MISHQFKNHLVSFFDELIDQFPSESDFIAIRFIVSKVEPDTLIHHFTEKLLPFKDVIVANDEDFFLENDIISTIIGQENDINESKIDYFKKIWKSSQLDTEDKKIIWEWFELFVTLAEKHKISIQ